jgi:Tfp pilus assembly protein PilP
MNVTKTISIVMLTAAMAWAQSATTKTANSTATTKKTTTAAGATATKPASQMAPSATKSATAPKTAVKTAPMAKSTAPAAAKSATAAKAATVAKTTAHKGTTAKGSKPAKPAAPAKVAAKPAVTPTQRAESLTKPIGKRDPFVSVIVARNDSSAACTGGKRCLVIDQLALRGIVRTPSKWIALVENPAKKTYYLYENDPIYNAVVVRITGDSVIFRETVMDALGHSTEREVVKRVSAPAI